MGGVIGAARLDGFQRGANECVGGRGGLGVDFVVFLLGESDHPAADGQYAEDEHPHCQHRQHQQGQAVGSTDFRCANPRRHRHFLHEPDEQRVKPVAVGEINRLQMGETFRQGHIFDANGDDVCLLFVQCFGNGLMHRRVFVGFGRDQHNQQIAARSHPRFVEIFLQPRGEVGFAGRIGDGQHRFDLSFQSRTKVRM